MVYQQILTIGISPEGDLGPGKRSMMELLVKTINSFYLLKTFAKISTLGSEYVSAREYTDQKKSCLFHGAHVYTHVR